MKSNLAADRSCCQPGSLATSVPRRFRYSLARECSVHQQRNLEPDPIILIFMMRSHGNVWSAELNKVHNTSDLGSRFGLCKQCNRRPFDLSRATFSLMRISQSSNCITFIDTPTWDSRCDFVSGQKVRRRQGKVYLMFPISLSKRLIIVIPFGTLTWDSWRDYST